MLGFFIGTACLIGLASALRRHHHGHHGHHAWGPGGGNWGRRGRFGGFGPFGGMGRRAFYRLFQRLDTTPGQEKVIFSAISDLKEHAKDARAELRGTVNEVAEAIRSEVFDEESFSGIFDAHITRIEGMRIEFVKAVSKVHEALAPEQRDRLADLLESRARFAHAL